MPVVIYLRLSECDERISRSFGAAEAVFCAHAYTHNGSLGAAAITHTYSALHHANARADGFNRCGQYAASGTGLLLYMVQSLNVVIEYDVGPADDAV